MKNLENIKCKPCNAETPKLDSIQIKENLINVDSWSINDQQEMIFKKFKFKNFKNTIEFVNKVGTIAENEKHHPDISFGWGYCLIMIHTHAIKGLPLHDLILPAKIDQI